jgi:hypothetical protein
MTKVAAGITTSLDGYITGPNDGPGRGLGEGGERLHYWVFGGPWRYEEEPRGAATASAPWSAAATPTRPPGAWGGQVRDPHHLPRGALTSSASPGASRGLRMLAKVYASPTWHSLS